MTHRWYAFTTSLSSLPCRHRDKGTCLTFIKSSDPAPWSLPPHCSPSSAVDSYHPPIPNRPRVEANRSLSNNESAHQSDRSTCPPNSPQDNRDTYPSPLYSFGIHLTPLLAAGSNIKIERLCSGKPNGLLYESNLKSTQAVHSSGQQNIKLADRFNEVFPHNLRLWPNPVQPSDGPSLDVNSTTYIKTSMRRYLSLSCRWPSSPETNPRNQRR